jgi:tetratricopeptide (TPR) repeat protein
MRLGGVMRFFTALIAVAVSAALIGDAHAASRQDQEDCMQVADPDRNIAGCTRIIEDQTESTGMRGASYGNRAVAYSIKKDYARAIADFSEAIQFDPNATDNYVNRGFAYYNSNDYDRAIADFNEAIRLDPDKADHYYVRAHAYFQKGDKDHAVADLKKVLAIDPSYEAADAELRQLGVTP